MADSTKTFKERIKEALLNKDAKQALRLVKEIRKMLRSGDLAPNVRSSLVSIKAKLTIVGLTFMSDQTIEQTLEKNPLQMMDVFDIEDLISKFKARLQDEAFAEDRNTLRDKWRAALERSQQEVGASAVKLGTQDVRPTVENWIKIYNSEVGSGKVSTVKVAKLFTQYKSLQEAPENVVVSIRRLFDFVEFLKLRSDMLEGVEGEILVEDQDGNLASITDGVVEPVFTQADLRNFQNLARQGKLGAGTLIDLKIQYPEMFGKFKVPIKLTKATMRVSDEQAQKRAVQFFKDKEAQYGKMEFKSAPLPQQQLGEFINSLPKARKEDLKKIKMNLAQVVNKKEEFVAFMRKGGVGDLIKREFPKELGDKNKEMIKQSVYSPMAFQALLQIVLLKKMRLSDDEALWHAFEIVHKFPMTLKDFKTLVTFDVTKNKLVWRY